jgi:hypothetical protein
MTMIRHVPAVALDVALRKGHLSREGRTENRAMAAKTVRRGELRYIMRHSIGADANGCEV